MKAPKQVPLPIHTMFSQVMHYGACTYDKETQEGNHYYRTRYFNLDGFMYEVVQRDGQLIIFKFAQIPE